MKTEPVMRIDDMSWFESLGGMLDSLAQEIRLRHHRPPDVGDLLIVLASQRHTVAGELAADLGVDLDELVRRLEGIRQTFVSPWDRIEGVRQRKELAIEAGDLALADQLLDKERRLSHQLRQDQEIAVNELRARLGLLDGTQS